MSAEKCPVCGAGNSYPRFSPSGRFDCSFVGLDRHKCSNAEREVDRLTAKLAKWESELSKVMPPDFKDWWQNSRDEWPEIARWVIQAGRAQQSSAWEHVEKLTTRVEQLERELKDANELIHLMSMRKET